MQTHIHSRTTNTRRAIVLLVVLFLLPSITCVFVLVVVVLPAKLVDPEAWALNPIKPIICPKPMSAKLNPEP